MKLFLTGATGFIGKHLVEKLLSQGYSLTVNVFGNEENFFGNKVCYYRLQEKDIKSDIEYFRNECFDGIIHLASLYITTHQPEDIGRLIDTNLKFSTYILECSVQSKTKWFINTGTFWQNYCDADYSPVNLYAATKQAFEDIGRYYVETDQILFYTIKLCDTFGPGDTRPKIFNLWSNCSKSGESLDMSLGEQLIDISYIDDVVNAYCIMISNIDEDNIKLRNGEVFAVNASERYTLKQLAEIFEGVTKCKLKINWGRKLYRPREVMIPWRNGKPVPNWKPEVSLKEGIKRTFETVKQLSK